MKNPIDFGACRCTVGAPVHPKVHPGFQTILTAILIRFTSNLEYSLGMGLGRSLLILVYVGALGGATCAPKGAPWFPDDPDRHYRNVHVVWA